MNRSSSIMKQEILDISGGSSTTITTMEKSCCSVEGILKYRFKNKLLLEEALTHSSYNTNSVISFERLEFIGDAALGLAISNYAYLADPKLEPGDMSLFRAVNISTEKLARVAVKHGFYKFMRHNVVGLDEKVEEFVEAVGEEDSAFVHSGSVKAPKVLADIVESIAAAIYVDVDFDLEKLWLVFRGLLEPIISLEDLKKQPESVSQVFQVCQAQGKQVDIKHKGDKDMEPVKSRMFESFKIDGSFEIRGVGRLHNLCCKKKWPEPTYKTEKDEGHGLEKKVVCSVQIETSDGGVLNMTGEEMSSLKKAKASAASLMINYLRESPYL